MGYISTVHGEWTITPPLNARELRAMPTGLQCIRIEVDEETRETDEGQLIVQSGVEVVPAIHEGKVYDLENELSTMLRAIPSSHKVTGEIIRVGEENGDVERYLPADPDSRALRTEQARLSWPDGTEVKY